MLAKGSTLAGAFVGGFVGPIVAMFRAMWIPISAFLTVLGVLSPGMSSAVAIAGFLGKMFGYMATFILMVVGAITALISLVVGPLVAAFGIIAAGFSSILWVPAFIASMADSMASMATDLGSAAVDIGTNIVAGIVGGLESGRAWIVATVAGLGETIISTVKGVLGIASPSKVMAQMGQHTADGFAVGLDRGSDGVDRAMAAVVEPPGAGAAGGAAGGAGRGGGPISITVPITIMMGSGRDEAESLAGDIERRLRLALENIVTELGLGPEPETT
jgi:hypothetical protein